MQTKPKHTIVVMPNDDKIEVSYFCSDEKLKESEKNDGVNLIIQLHDCHCSYKISKSALKDPSIIESIVQHRVINAKGHLC